MITWMVALGEGVDFEAGGGGFKTAEALFIAKMDIRDGLNKVHTCPCKRPYVMALESNS